MGCLGDLIFDCGIPFLIYIILYRSEQKRKRK